MSGLVGQNTQTQNVFLSILFLTSLDSMSTLIPWLTCTDQLKFNSTLIPYICINFIFQYSLVFSFSHIHFPYLNQEQQLMWGGWKTRWLLAIGSSFRYLPSWHYLYHHDLNNGMITMLYQSDHYDNPQPKATAHLYNSVVIIINLLERYSTAMCYLKSVV